MRADEGPALAQAAYFVVTGLWPLLSLRTFEAVSGPKFDAWLVKTVGLLVSVIGLAVGSAGIRRTRQPEIKLLAIGSALALAVVDVLYVTVGRISKVYLLDAVIEVLFIFGWLRACRRTDYSPH